MALILETDTGSSANISAELAIGEYTASRDTLLTGFVKISAMNGAAATLTCVLRGKASGGTNEGEPDYYSFAKRTAADTVAAFSLGPIVLNSGEKAEVRVKSSNASDTAVTWSVDWVDAQQVDVVSFGGTAGTFASGRPDVNMTYIAGSVVSASTAQLGVNVVNFGGSAGTFASGRPEANATHWGGTAIASANVRANVIQWNTTNVPAEHTAGYPIVTIKDGTGTGEIDTTSGGVKLAAAQGTVTFAQLISTLAFQADLDGDVLGDVDGGVNGTVAAVALLSAEAITANSFAANAITAAKIAADAGTEIGVAVWAETTRTLTGTQVFNLTGNVTGNLSGSVGSVTGAVGSVTGAVGSITGITFPMNFSTLGINASGHVSRVVLVDTVTTLTNLPAITSNWLTAAGLAADAATEIANEVEAQIINEADAEQVLAAILAKINASGLTTDAAIVAAVKVALETSVHASGLPAIKTQLGTAGAGLTAVPWNASWDAEVESEATDALTAYGPLKPTTAGRTLDVSAGGEAGIDWANVGSPTTTLNLSGTTIATVSSVTAVTALATADIWSYSTRTLTGPVRSVDLLQYGEWAIVKGDSRLNADGRAVAFVKETNAPWPSTLVTGSFSVKMEIEPSADLLADVPAALDLQVSGTIVDVSNVRFDFTAAQTATLSPGKHLYNVVAHKSGVQYTLESGVLTVEDNVDA